MFFWIKVVVFGNNGCILAKMDVFLQGGCIRKSGCIRAKLLYWGKMIKFGQSSCIWAKVVAIRQSGCT